MLGRSTQASLHPLRSTRQPLQLILLISGSARSKAKSMSIEILYVRRWWLVMYVGVRRRVRAV